MEISGIRVGADRAVDFPKPPSNGSHHSASDRATQEITQRQFPVADRKKDRERPLHEWVRLLG